MFVGDLLHSPMQLVDPDCCISFDEDEPQARATRLLFTQIPTRQP